MGADRELKKANEAYWADKLSRDDLIKEGKRLRLEHWKIQKDAGVDVIPSNRLSQSVTPALSCLLSMSTSPWAVVTRRTVSTFPVW